MLEMKGAFWSKGLKVNLGETIVIISRDISKDGLSRNKVYPIGVCSLKVTASSVLCVEFWN